MLFVNAASAQETNAATDPAAGVSAVGTPSDAQQPGGETHSEVGAPGGGQDEAFPPMNPEYFPSQILWLAITFGIFYWVLKNVLVPRIGGVLENRRDRIALDVESAERAKQDADEAQAAYEQELAEARERAQIIAQEARNEAKDEADEQREKLEAELDARLDEARERIAVAKSNAMRDMDQMATDVAETILRDVVKLDVTTDEVSSAVASSRS